MGRDSSHSRDRGSRRDRGDKRSSDRDRRDRRRSHDHHSNGRAQRRHRDRRTERSRSPLAPPLPLPTNPTPSVVVGTPFVQKCMKNFTGPFGGHPSLQQPRTIEPQQLVQHFPPSTPLSAPPRATPMASIDDSVPPPPAAVRLSATSSPTEVYEALCAAHSDPNSPPADYRNLPPGWEQVVFKGVAVYLDHVSREAHEETPWVVWRKRSAG